MKRIFVIACTICGLAFGGEKRETPPPTLDGVPHEKIDAEKLAKEHDAAMARLPALDGERLEHIVNVLGETKFPVTFDTLLQKLGGPGSLVWCCTHSQEKKGDKFAKQTSTFFIAANAPDYQLVVDYEDFPVDERPTKVIRARLCYNSPLGWRFNAESVDDMVRVGEPVAPMQNQTKPISDPAVARRDSVNK